MSNATVDRRDRPVVMLLPYVSMSGLELFGLRFARSLETDGQPCLIAAPAGSRIAAQCEKWGLDWTDLPVGYRADPRLVTRFCDWFRRRPPLALVGFRTQVLYPLRLACLLSHHHPAVYLFYRLGAGNQHRRDPLHRRLFRWLRAVVPNADHVANKIRSRWAIDPGKVVCIKSGVDVGRYRPDPAARAAVRQRLGIGADALVFGNTGRIHPEKGSAWLIETLFGPERGGEGGAGGDARRATAADPGLRDLAQQRDVHLVYVGAEHTPGYADQLHRLARRCGAESRLHWLPFTDDIAGVYPAFDHFVLPVRSHETYAYVTLEAMACGVPPIVPFVGGMKEMFTDGSEGFFYEFRSQRALAERLRSAIELTPEHRRRMGEAARRRIVASASWETMMDAYRRLFAATGVPLRADGGESTPAAASRVAPREAGV